MTVGGQHHERSPRLDRLAQRGQTGGLHSIVIGQEKAHDRPPSVLVQFERVPGTLTRRASEGIEVTIGAALACQHDWSACNNWVAQTTCCLGPAGTRGVSTRAAFAEPTPDPSCCFATPTTSCRCHPSTPCQHSNNVVARRVSVEGEHGDFQTVPLLPPREGCILNVGAPAVFVMPAVVWRVPRRLWRRHGPSHQCARAIGAKWGDAARLSFRPCAGCGAGDRLCDSGVRCVG